VPGQYLRFSDCDATEAASADVDGDTDANAEGNRTTPHDQAMSTIQRVLDTGTPGVHYATSYIGVYNLLRSYGRFVVLANEDVNDNEKDDNEKDDDDEDEDDDDDDYDNQREFRDTVSTQDARREKGTSMTTTTKDAAPKIVPLDYHGPPLPR